MHREMGLGVGKLYQAWKYFPYYVHVLHETTL